MSTRLKLILAWSGLFCLAIANADAQTITPIADIQANPNAFLGTVVTVEGQVYIPTNYRGTIISGYIQDDSGRGINLFGTGADDPLLLSTSNVVRVTGAVDLYFTTVEIVNVTVVTLVSSGNPPLQPVVLSTGAAASSAWEGTFIQVSGQIAAKAIGGPGWNYTVNDGSGPINVRVVDALGVPEFDIGQTITARGAGGQFQSFEVLVGSAADVFVGSGSDMSPPILLSASSDIPTQIVVDFSEPVTLVTAEATGNYEVFETTNSSNTIAVTNATLDVSGRLVTLGLGGALQDAVGYTVRVNNVQDLAGNTIAPSSSVTFTYSATTVTPIAEIQADPVAFAGLVVTIEGQVYIPTNYRGTLISGYIQDGSGRGINLFGSGADSPVLFDTGNFARVTGTVALFFTTVEIIDITSVSLLSSGNPPLQPAVLSTGAAASSVWEGTFIQVTAVITEKVTAGFAWNYTVTDGSGPIVVRVVDVLGAPEFDLGQTITARGAGSQFGTDYQILVGNEGDVFRVMISADGITWTGAKAKYR